MRPRISLVSFRSTDTDSIVGLSRARRWVHRDKLVALRTLLEATPAADGGNKNHCSDIRGMNELDATAEKCGVLKNVLLGLVDKRAGLEQQCMALEEQTSRETVTLISKKEQLIEGMKTKAKGGNVL